MKKTSIKLNAIVNGIRNVLNLLFPLITFPYVSRTLSVSGIGKYNFSSSIISYFLLLAALGIDKYTVREGAKYRDDRQKMSQFVSEAFTFNLISTLVSYLLLFSIMAISSKLRNYTLCILIFSLQIVFTTLGVEWVYSIYEQYFYITVRSIVFKLISLVLLFALVRKPGDYLYYAAITVFSTVGSNILNFIHLRKYCDIKISFDLESFKKMLKPIMIIFASNIAIQIYVNADTTMLGYLKNDYVVGIYSISTKIYSIIKMLLASILIVTIPRLAMYVGKKMYTEYNELLFNVVNVLILVIVPAIVGLFFLSKDIILIISGKDYIRSTSSLRILCFAIILSILSGTFNECVLIPYKREKKVLVSSIVSAVVNVLLNFWMIPWLSEDGAAITTVIAEFLSLAINYYYSRDIVKKIIVNKKTILNMISVFFGSFLVAIICIIVNMYINQMILRLVVQLLLSIVIYLLILFITKNQFVMAILKKNLN